MGREKITLDRPTFNRVKRAVMAVEADQARNRRTAGETRSTQGRRTIAARLLTDVGSGAYTAEAVAWNGAAWAVTDDGLSWGGGSGDAGYLQSVGLGSGAMGSGSGGVDPIVMAHSVRSNSGTHWLFSPIGPPGAHMKLLGGQLAHVDPITPTTPITIGAASEGTEAADTGSGTAAEAGVILWCVSRVGYFETGDETLYMYLRPITIDVKGHIVSIGAETRVSVDVPEACT